MVVKMENRTPSESGYFTKILTLFALGVFACGGERNTQFDPSRLEGNRCQINFECSASNRKVAMTLQCLGPAHTDCFVIEKLMCNEEDQGVTKPLTIQNCPVEGNWCLGDCIESVEGGNAPIWEMPDLKNRPACALPQSSVCAP